MKKISQFFTIMVLGLLGVVSSQATVKVRFVSSPAPAPTSASLNAYYTEGMQFCRSGSAGSVFTKTRTSWDAIHYDILKWSDLALSSTGGKREAIWVIISDDAGIKHHPREFAFAIHSSDPGDTLRFVGNLATNTANGTELLFSPTTFMGVDNDGTAHTSGSLVPVNTIITPLRVWLNDSASAPVESYVVGQDPFRIITTITGAGMTTSFEISTAPILLVSSVKTLTLVGQPSSLATYTIQSSVAFPANWQFLAGSVPNGWSQSFTDNLGSRFFRAYRGGTSSLTAKSVARIPQAGFSQTD